MELGGWTFLFQIINFLVLVWLLQRFLYRPVQRIIEQRRQMNEEVVQTARQRQAEAEESQRSYECMLEQLADERKRLTKTVHTELADEKAAMLDQARREAADVKKALDAELEAHKNAAVTFLKVQLFDLSARLARLLTAEIDANAINDSLLKRTTRYFEDLGDEDRKQLIDSVASAGEGVHVVTAEELSGSLKSQWQECLGRALTKSLTVEFKTDASVLGGALIRFPHAVLDLSWRKILQTTRARADVE